MSVLLYLALVAALKALSDMMDDQPTDLFWFRYLGGLISLSLILIGVHEW